MFDVTYEIVTPESAEQGDADECGFIGKGLSLRVAIEEIHNTRTSWVNGVESIECDSWPMMDPRWVTVTNGTEYETGAQESRSLHMSDNLTAATRRRIARLVGAN